MKQTKRILATLMAVVMMAAMMVVPASAENNHSITISGTSSTHTFTAYQIFTGGVANGSLSDPHWGTGVDSDALLTALKGSTDPYFVKDGTNIFTSCNDAKSLAETLAANITSIEATDAFAKIVATYLNGTGKTGTPSGDKYTISGLASGYYIILDRADFGETTGDALSKYMVQLSAETTDVTIAVKKDAPTITKSVSRNRDLTYTQAISASYADTVYFKLDGKLHTRIDDYSQYFYQVVDTLPAGLTFKQIESVQIVNDTRSFAVTNTSENTEYVVTQDGDEVTITFADVKATIARATGNPAVADDTVVIKYSATVNTGVSNTAATIGKAGNENKVKLIYSANPAGNYTTETATTATNTAYVYSYKVATDKIDGATNAKLANAQFTLHRNIDGIQYAKVDPATGHITGWTSDAAQASTLITDSNGAATFIGLSSGTYYLTETKAPDGYHTLGNNIPVTITASANATTGALETLTASATHGGVAKTAVETGLVTVTITNNSAPVLPTTGGMGTTLFYIAGIALMAGAAAVLITKKRGAQN